MWQRAKDLLWYWLGWEKFPGNKVIVMSPEGDRILSAESTVWVLAIYHGFVAHVVIMPPVPISMPATISTAARTGTHRMTVENCTATAKRFSAYAHVEWLPKNPGRLTPRGEEHAYVWQNRLTLSV